MINGTIVLSLSRVADASLGPLEIEPRLSLNRYSLIIINGKMGIWEREERVSVFFGDSSLSFNRVDALEARESPAKNTYSSVRSRFAFRLISDSFNAIPKHK